MQHEKLKADLQAIRNEHIGRVKRLRDAAHNQVESLLLKGHLIGFEICFVAICSYLNIDNPFSEDKIYEPNKISKINDINKFQNSKDIK